MSRKTICNNIEKIGDRLLKSLLERLNNVRYISIALDESVDISDTAQLLVFVRYVTSNFDIEEKLLTLIPMKNRTRGIDIHHELIAKIGELRVNANKIISISTDGAPSMTGKHTGFCSLFVKELSLDVFLNHCLIHRVALSSKCTLFEETIKLAWKYVKKIKSKSSLVHRQFKAFLESACFNDLKQYNHVRWLSAFQMLERFDALHDEVIQFLSEMNLLENEEYRLLNSDESKIKFKFCTDVLEEIAKLNKKLQGRNSLLIVAINDIRMFIDKLKILKECISSHSYDAFPRLSSCGLPISEELCKCMTDSLETLEESFVSRCGQILDERIENMSLKVVLNPFVNNENVSVEIAREIAILQNDALSRNIYNES
ncbi:hypothetical protein SNEBB_001928, partial [Seison nebaliae]